MNTISRVVALTLSLAALSACGKSSWQPREEAVPTSAVTLSVAFSAQGQALRPQGVPSTTSSVDVKVAHAGQEVLFDANGNPAKTGGSAITLDSQHSSKAVNLPTGV